MDEQNNDPRVLDRDHFEELTDDFKKWHEIIFRADLKHYRDDDPVVHHLMRVMLGTCMQLARMIRVLKDWDPEPADVAPPSDTSPHPRFGRDN